MFGSYLVRGRHMDSISQANTPTRDADTFPAPSSSVVSDALIVDVAAERERTAGASQSRHLNAAGSALPSIAVVETVVEHLRLEEAIGGYEAAARMRPQLEGVYDAAAELLGARPQ